jgi:hypothetical protein
MPTVHWGSAIAGALLGLLLYHFMKSRVSAIS